MCRKWGLFIDLQSINLVKMCDILRHAFFNLLIIKYITFWFCDRCMSQNCDRCMSQNGGSLLLIFSIVMFLMSQNVATFKGV